MPERSQRKRHEQSSRQPTATSGPEDRDTVIAEGKRVRLNRFLADSGQSSRRGADALIQAGRVRVNGQIASLGLQIDPRLDTVTLDGQTVAARRKPYVYLKLNKPQGITCTTDRRRSDNIIDFLDYPSRIYPIGRLDRDSEGLLLLTDDGSIVNRILRAAGHHEKEYLVEVDRPYNTDFLKAMANGVYILDQETLPARITPLSPTRFRLTLHQGLNRQIRRMCEALGFQVRYLQRLRIMNITLGNLALGEYRRLTPKELRDLRLLLEEAETKAEA